MISTNVRANESFLVAGVGVDAIPSSGTLNNTTTGAVNLTNGQLGFVSDSIWGTVALNAFTDATPTILEAPVIAIYQGTSQSANPSASQSAATYPLWARPFERTNPIDGRGEVRVTKQAYRVPAHSTWVVGATVGSTGEVNVLDNTEYEISVAFRGRRVEEMYGGEQAASLRASVVTPDFSALGYTDAEAVSWILHNLAWNINRNSTAFAINSRFPNNSPVLALLIDTLGTAANGQTITGGLAAGDVIDVAVSGSTTKSITLTAAQAASINAAAVAGYGDVIANVTWAIVPVNIAAADDAANLADVVMLIGLDDKLAFVDWIPQVKNRLEVGLSLGFNFNTVTHTEHVKADEGQGDGRSLDILYKSTHGQRKYNLRHTADPVTEFPSPIDTTGKYVVYNILHGSGTKPDIANTIYTPYREVICIPAFEDDGTTTNTYLATFQNVLNSWLASSTNNNAIVTLD